MPAHKKPGPSWVAKVSVRTGFQETQLVLSDEHGLLPSLGVRMSPKECRRLWQALKRAEEASK